jgi:peroxiredoxin
MRTMTRRLTLAGTAVVFTLAAAATAFAGVLAIGEDVPDVTLSMADGTDAKLSAHDGKAVVLFFYGAWNKKAPAEAARIDGIRKGRAKQKLVVVGVARDAKAADAKKFGEDHKLGFAQAADPKGELFKRFSEKGLPWVVVLDGKRKLKYSAGGVDEDGIEGVLTDLLGKKEPEKDTKKDEKAK